MKVLITTDMYTANVNGVVTSVRNLMEELEKKGHQVGTSKPHARQLRIAGTAI